MAIGARSRRLPVVGVGERRVPIGGLGFDWTMIGLSSWLMAGVLLDAWAHSHILSTLESFFTPWHGILYSGFLAASGFLVLAFYRNRVQGYAWRRAVPRGYELSLIAMLIFALGGVGDLLWHTLFGIEANLEAALSPTHLLLALGIVLFLTGPFRAAWHRHDPAKPSWLTQLPMLLSLTYALSIMNLLTEFAHPLANPLAATSAGGQTGEMLGVASVMVQSALLMGWVLLLVRRWVLVPGAFTFLFTLNALLLSILQDHWFLVPAALGAGVVADLLRAKLQPSTGRSSVLRVFAFAVPAMYYLLYFVDLMVAKQVVWTVHLWVGSVFIAGLAGLTLSYLLVPPVLPGGEVV